VAGLARACPEDFLAFRLKVSEVNRLQAALELGRRATAPRGERPQISQSTDIWNYYRGRIGHLGREVMHILCLDSKNRVLRDERVADGEVAQCAIHPRQVLGPIIRSNAHSAVLVHNHPSGDPAPSENDLRITGRLVRAAAPLGIVLCDHVILGDGVFYSMLDEGVLAGLAGGERARAVD
jgi:DNA repair protein RadC